MLKNTFPTTQSFKACFAEQTDPVCDKLFSLYHLVVEIPAVLTSSKC